VKRLAQRAAIVILIVAPLIAGSVWIYEASAGAFRTEHEIRVARNAREQLKDTFLAAESDVRGFAATHDPYFLRAYDADHRAFAPLVQSLRPKMRDLGITSADRVITSLEQTYQRWAQTVAAPILAQRAGRSTADVLRKSDASLTQQMLSEDRQLGFFLDDTASASEARRQTLLQRILFASVSLVLAAAGVVGVLLKARILYEDERRITAVLQSALAPEPLPELENAQFDAIYVPAASARAVGGDWYEALELRDGRLLLLMGDVAGHGLEAAVVMNRARQAILAGAVTERDPARTLTKANAALVRQSSPMVTAACCVVDPRRMQLVYASAGHPPPILASPSSPATALRNGGPPLGITDDLRLESYDCVLEAGSLLVLYTDGLIENERDIVEGETRLVRVVAQHRQAPYPARAIFEAMLGDATPRDDVAILTVRLAGESGRLAQE
jgi:serine phosphatase RsbU (regulator of sigma subunit)